MPFYLRKSISAGPFRFNLSKSGFGLSVGVRGLRIGTGPRGHYIHAGAHGFYYRASLGGAGQKSTRQSSVERVERRPTPVSSSDNVEMLDIESGDVLAMTDARFQDLLDDINRKCRQLPMAWVLAWVCGGAAAGITVAGLSAWVFAAVPFAYLVGIWLDSFWRTVVLYYDLDPPTAAAFRRFVDAFEEMGKCRGAWHIAAEGRIRDVTTWKRNAGASNLVKRSSVALALELPSVVRSNLDPPHLRVGKQELFFFPDFVLVLVGSSAGAIPYDQLNISIESARFIEDGRLPSDAEVVGHTWQHPNKSGGPDRRFARNRQIPVCLYEEVHLTSPTGLQEVIQLSKVGAAETFASAIPTLAQTASAIIDARTGAPTSEAVPQPVNVRASPIPTNVACIAAAILIAAGTPVVAGWMVHLAQGRTAHAPAYPLSSGAISCAMSTNKEWCHDTREPQRLVA